MIIHVIAAFCGKMVGIYYAFLDGKHYVNVDVAALIINVLIGVIEVLIFVAKGYVILAVVTFW